MVSMIQDFQGFGQALIETEDLDPVYSCLWRVQLPEPQLCRWLTAYLMFYHVGSASYLSEREGAEFWSACLVAADNTRPAPNEGRWPRLSERRYFRGSACTKAVDALSLLAPDPEALWRELRGCSTEGAVIRHVKRFWPMHGPWAGFKAADLAERVCGYPIKFSRDTGLLYGSPRMALDTLVGGVREQLLGECEDARAVYDAQLLWVGGFRAPPGRDRPCGPQELETVLCKWGSLRSGHYVLGKDIHEVGEALRAWAPHSQTAERMLMHVPRAVESKQRVGA